MDYIVTI